MMPDRFWPKVDRRGPDECWPWLAGKSSGGYGRYSIGGRKRVQAHRFAYEALRGPIPDGLHIDHLCRNRGCINPAHMEPVTNRENILRGNTIPAAQAAKTHCKRGHPFSGDNLFVRKNGDRMCRTCNKSYPPYRLAASESK